MVCNKKRKPVFIKRKWNHVFSRATFLSFHYIYIYTHIHTYIYVDQPIGIMVRVFANGPGDCGVWKFFSVEVTDVVFKGFIVEVTNVGLKGFYEGQWLRARLCCRKLSDSIFLVILLYPTLTGRCNALPKEGPWEIYKKEKIRTD